MRMGTVPEVIGAESGRVSVSSRKGNPHHGFVKAVKVAFAKSVCGPLPAIVVTIGRQLGLFMEILLC